MQAIANKKDRTLSYITLAIFILSLIYIFPRCLYHNFEDITGDRGWIDALKFFAQNVSKYRWGVNIIYTYGPFGMFSTRQFPNNLWWCQILVDLYAVTNLCIIFAYLRKHGSRIDALLFALCIFAAIWEINFMLQTLSLFSFFMYCKSGNKKYSFFIILTSVFLLYTKLNTVLFSCVLIGSLFFVHLKRKEFVYVLIHIAAIIVLNAIIIKYLNIDIKAYLYSAIDTITCYPENMYYGSYGNSFLFYAGIFFSLMVVLTMLLQFSYKKPFSEKNILLINGFILYYLAYKQGYTRLDIEHLLQYIHFAPFALLYIHLVTGGKWYTWLPLTVSIFGCYQLVAIAAIKHRTYCRYCGDTLPLVTYIQQAIEHPKQNEKQYFSAGSYDYCDMQCYKVTLNPNKNWHNRPAFQSMVSVSARFDSLNAAWYRSANAPDTIFYSYEVVDNRNPIWEEPQVKWTMMSRYRYATTTADTQVVLVKSGSILHYTDELITDTTIGVNTQFALPTYTGMLTMSAEVHYSVYGRIRSALFDATPITLYAGGDSTNYEWRYIPAVHNKQQLIVNYFPAFDSLGAFLQNLNNIKPNIDTIMFHCKQPLSIKPEIHLQLYRRKIAD